MGRRSGPPRDLRCDDHHPNSRRAATGRSSEIASACTPISTPAIPAKPTISPARQRTLPYRCWLTTPARDSGQDRKERSRLGVELRRPRLVRAPGRRRCRRRRRRARRARRRGGRGRRDEGVGRHETMSLTPHSQERPGEPEREPTNRDLLLQRRADDRAGGAGNANERRRPNVHVTARRVRGSCRPGRSRRWPRARSRLPGTPSPMTATSSGTATGPAATPKSALKSPPQRPRSPTASPPAYSPARAR